MIVSKKITPPLIFNNPEDGTLIIGSESSAVLRTRQVQLAAGSGANVRLFEDGGWEVKAQPNTKGSNIIQKGEGPLNIESEGDLNIDCKGTLSITADKIVFDCDDFITQASNDIRLDADNNTTILGTNIVIKANQNVLTSSDGWNIISGNPVFIHEKKSKLIPTGVGDVIDMLLDQIVLGV